MQSRSEPLPHFSEEDEEAPRKKGEDPRGRRLFTEFDCPTCSANNPHEGFGNQDEVRCGYCGVGFLALVDEDGKLKLREE